MWFLPLAAALVSGAFATLVGRSYASRRGPHLLAWAVALALFALASLSAALGMALEWSTALFRSYYLFGAIVNVPILALGTVYLLASRRRTAHVAAMAVGVLCLGAAVDVSEARLRTEALENRGIPSASEVMPDSVRTLSRIYSFAGFFVVAGGAIYSAVRLRRSGRDELRRLAAANGLIALGTTVVAVGSGLARYGEGGPFAIGLLVGVTLMFVGFLRTRPKAAVG